MIISPSVAYGYIFFWEVDIMMSKLRECPYCGYRVPKPCTRTEAEHCVNTVSEMLAAHTKIRSVAPDNEYILPRQMLAEDT